MNRCSSVFLLCVVLVSTTLAQNCWQKATKREVFHHDSCPDGWENYFDACYGPCPSGYLPSHDECYKNVTCPPPMIEAGDTCLKPSSYSRPVYPLFEQEECERNHYDVGGCELVGPMWMPKCKSGFHGVLTECVYSCPKDFEDHLASCAKPSKSRPEKEHICPPNTTEDADGDYCYKACEANHLGVGQVCWGKCPSTHKVCSEALCIENANYDKQCTPEESAYMKETYDHIDFYLHTTPGNIQLQTALNVVTGYHYEMCATIGSFRKRWRLA